MATLIATCPRKGVDVSTGIDLDLNSFSQLPDVPVRFRCPACATDHVTRAASARLRNDTWRELGEAVATACERSAK